MSINPGSADAAVRQLADNITALLDRERTEARAAADAHWRRQVERAEAARDEALSNCAEMRAELTETRAQLTETREQLKTEGDNAKRLRKMVNEGAGMRAELTETRTQLAQAGRGIFEVGLGHAGRQGLHRIQLRDPRRCSAAAHAPGPRCSRSH